MWARLLHPSQVSPTLGAGTKSMATQLLLSSGPVCGQGGYTTPGGCAASPAAPQPLMLRGYRRSGHCAQAS